MRHAAYLITLYLCAALVNTAGAAEYYVDTGSGSDISSGRSWAEAFATVARALTAAKQDGYARINVAAGSYLVESELLDSRVWLVGGFSAIDGSRNIGANETVLSANGAETTLTFTTGSDGSIVDGFTVTGAASSGLLLNSETVVRNCTLRDNTGTGVEASKGAIENNRVLRNGRWGISIRDLSLEPVVRVRWNTLEENLQAGIFVERDVSGWTGPVAYPSVRIEHNRILRTRISDGFAIGLILGCCPRVFNNEILNGEGEGVLIQNPGPEALNLPGTAVLHTTITGNAGPALHMTSNPVFAARSMTLSHVVLWNNGGGDLDNPPPILDIEYSLSQQPLAGPGNISGVDPLLTSGANSEVYLSHVAAGQGSDSIAIDAGGITAEQADLRYRTTRTDEIWDADTVDLGFHPEPSQFTVFRGTDPSTPLPVLQTDVNLPTVDLGAIGAAQLEVWFYSVSSDMPILLKRADSDIDIRFNHQQFDE